MLHLRMWDTQEPTSPLIKAIGIHRLSEQSHGNGGGMALADIVSKKFFDALDLQLTWKHMISCNWTVGGKIPVRWQAALLLHAIPAPTSCG